MAGVWGAGVAMVAAPGMLGPVARAYLIATVTALGQGGGDVRDSLASARSLGV